MSLTTRLSALFAAITMSAAMFAVPAHAADAPAAEAAPAASAPAAAPAADAAAPAAPASALPPGKEEIANPYGPAALIKDGVFVARGTFVILLIMSIGSWYITVTNA